jgi:hypothetical protein
VQVDPLFHILPYVHRPNDQPLSRERRSPLSRTRPTHAAPLGPVPSLVEIR